MKEFEASHADYLGKDESKQKKTGDFPTLRENSASLWRIEAKGKSGLGASRRDLDTARETQRSKNHTTFFQVKSSPGQKMSPRPREQRVGVSWVLHCPERAGSSQ